MGEKPSESIWHRANPTHIRTDLISVLKSQRNELHYPSFIHRETEGLGPEDTTSFMPALLLGQK